MCKNTTFGVALAAGMSLALLAVPVDAAECHKAPPTGEQLPTAFCIDGNFPQGGQNIFSWTLDRKQSRHPWMWSLRGSPGAVTRFEIFRSGTADGRRPVYTLLDRAPLEEANPRVVRAGETDTIILRPGRYLLRVSCDGECTGKGDPYHLETVAAPSTGFEYQRERAAQGYSGQVQQVGDVFTLDGDLVGSPDTYAWTMAKGDAATCWQLDLMLPVDEHGWIRLYAPDGRLLAQRQVAKTVDNMPVFSDLGLKAGRYLIRVGPGKHGYTPYRLFSTPLGSRFMGTGPAGFTLACPVLQGE